MAEEERTSIEPVRQFGCDDCDQPFKTAQGLAGHRRLAHSTSTRSELEARAGEVSERETAAKRREAEVARQAEAARRREVAAATREQEIAEYGPEALGYEECTECSGWLREGELGAHARTVHPLERKVATEFKISEDRVVSVWREAAHKQERHPNESPDQIVRRFWDDTDQKILRALLAGNAAFHLSKGA
jgi:hypothetical protein